MSEDEIDGVETILEVGAEGGAITLRGRRDARGAWQFQVSIQEGGLWELIDEEPPDRTAEEAPWVDSWDGALSELGRNPWPKLCPLVVHPDFADAILDAVTAHERIGATDVSKWRAFVARSRSRAVS
jgi:hypothetical protein